MEDKSLKIEENLQIKEEDYPNYLQDFMLYYNIISEPIGHISGLTVGPLSREPNPLSI